MRSGFRHAVKYVLPRMLLGPVFHFLHYCDTLKVFTTDRLGGLLVVKNYIMLPFYLQTCFCWGEKQSCLISFLQKRFPILCDMNSLENWGYRGGSPTAVRPSDPALCGSCPLVTPYYCRLGDLLCFMCVYRFVCALLSLHVCLCCFRCLICFL